MPFKKNSPGCNASGGCKCSPPECEIASDDFNREDNGDISDGGPIEWTGYEIGFTTLVDNRINFAATTPERVTCGTTHPESTGTGVVYCTFETASSGDEVEVWLNADDDENCTVARLTVGAGGKIELITRISNSDTVVAAKSVSLGGAGIYTLWLKYDAARGLAEVSVVDGATVTSVGNFGCNPIAEIGDAAGFGTGSYASEIWADNFNFEKLGDGSNGCHELAGSWGPCDISFDDFNRANNSNISVNSPCGWTEVSGTWAINSNKLRSTAAGLAVATPAHATSVMVISADFSRTSNGNVHIIVAYVDSSNYWYARFVVGTGEVQIRKVVGGVDSFVNGTFTSVVNGTSLDTSTTYTGKVCINEAGDITAYVNPPNPSAPYLLGVPMVTAYAQSPTGTQAGLGAGTGTTDFDNFLFQKSIAEVDDCEQCAVGPPANCQQCCLASPRPDLIFYWPGGFTDLSGCTRCSVYMGSATEYTLTPGSTACTWQYSNTAHEACTDGEPNSCESTAPPGGLRITAEMIVDTTTPSRTCYIRVRVLQYTRSPPTCYLMWDLHFMTPTGIGNIDVCSGEEYDLVEHSEFSGATNYRSATGWAPGYSGGCGGSIAGTPTIRADV